MSNDKIVFVSGYNAPEDFYVIWSKNVKLTGNGGGKKRTEKLFIVNK